MSEAYARHSDPDTSHEAAETCNVAFLESVVLQVLKDAYPRAMTWRDLSEHPDIKSRGIGQQSVSPRLRPLCNKGLIENTGERAMGYKKSQILWRYKP